MAERGYRVLNVPERLAVRPIGARTRRRPLAVGRVQTPARPPDLVDFIEVTDHIAGGIGIPPVELRSRPGGDPRIDRVARLLVDVVVAAEDSPL